MLLNVSDSRFRLAPLLKWPAERIQIDSIHKRSIIESLAKATSKGKSPLCWLFLKSSSSNFSLFYRTRESTFEQWSWEDWKIYRARNWRSRKRFSFIKKTPGGWKAEESIHERQMTPRFSTPTPPTHCRTSPVMKIPSNASSEWVRAENSVFKVRKWVDKRVHTLHWVIASKVQITSLSLFLPYVYRSKALIIQGVAHRTNLEARFILSAGKNDRK